MNELFEWVQTIWIAMVHVLVLMLIYKTWRTWDPPRRVKP